MPSDAFKNTKKLIPNSMNSPGCSQKTAQQQVTPDDHSEVVPLLPIPNRTVKRLRANDSAGSRVKVGHRQAPTAPKPLLLLSSEGFCIWRGLDYFRRVCLGRIVRIFQLSFAGSWLAAFESPQMTFLAIDAGNTRVKWAQYSAPRQGAKLLAQGVEFLENLERLAEIRWPELSAPTSVLGCIVAGEGIRRRIEEQMELWNTSPRWVVPASTSCDVINGYDQPARLGADRWVAMIGARQRVLRSPGTAQPALVVMVGTAVTVDALDAEGRFLGGLIIPGHGIMLRALESGTAGLHVPTGSVKPFPTNTSDALTSGGTFAIAGAVAHMAAQLEKHCGIAPRCIMTGGAGWKMVPHMSVQVELAENLIFEGLLTIAERTFGQSPGPTTYPEMLF